MSDIPPIQPAQSVGGTSVDTRRLASQANLDAAGQQFEAVFTGMMVKSMRSTHLAEDLFGSKAADTFKDMQDTRLAQHMASHAPLGIGKAMTAFLGPSLGQASGKAKP